jgi:hypothetical protein
MTSPSKGAAAIPSAAHELKAIGQIDHDRIDTISRQRGQHLAAVAREDADQG